MSLSSGERSASQMQRWMDGLRDGKETVTRCAIPPCRGGILHVGTAADGREAARQHREERHPDVDVTTKRRRLTPAQQKEAAMARSEWKRRRWRGEE